MFDGVFIVIFGTLFILAIFSIISIPRRIDTLTDAVKEMTRELKKKNNEDKK